MERGEQQRKREPLARNGSRTIHLLMDLHNNETDRKSFHTVNIRDKILWPPATVTGYRSVRLESKDKVCLCPQLPVTLWILHSVVI